MFELAVLAASSFGLGALHAVEPGHGKTVVAAYLVGSRGRWYHAVHLGIVVTVTHTFGIIVLGFLIAYSAAHSAAENVSHWLQVASPLLIILVGGWMLRQQLKGAAQGRHQHSHDHHGHTHHSHRIGQTTRRSLWGLTALGMSGGMIPCPAALAVLLAAVGSGRLAQAVSLVVIFSLGMACVLVAIGLIVVRASRWAERVFEGAAWLRYTPVVSASVVTILGVALFVLTLLDNDHHQHQ